MAEEALIGIVHRLDPPDCQCQQVGDLRDRVGNNGVFHDLLVGSAEDCFDVLNDHVEIAIELAICHLGPIALRQNKFVGDISRTFYQG